MPSQPLTGLSGTGRKPSSRSPREPLDGHPTPHPLLAIVGLGSPVVDRSFRTFQTLDRFMSDGLSVRDARVLNAGSGLSLSLT
jgi:hypothetical protein